MTTTAVRPFRIDVPQDMLDDLHQRLDRTRFPGEVADSGWQFGTNLAYLKELVAYWRNEYDWRKAEARLNELPQFMANVNGEELHFVHVRGKGPNPMPLLFSHGWPGSFWEVSKIIGPLTDPAAYGGDPADSFDVVAPSLPGYGFSPDPGHAGISPAVIADLFASLMTDVLGYRRFAAQGGDWGAVITGRIGYAHAEKLIGIHMNMMGVRPFTGEGTPPLSDAEKAFLSEAEQWRQAETGYQWIQGTKPQTLAYGLTDSPAGLAGWITEKFRSWSDCDGDVERRFSKDDLLTNIMIYWVTGCIGSSVRLYLEARRNPWGLRAGETITVPTGYARFAVEITRPPREWVERAVNLHRFTEFPNGGHFAAMEEPDAIVTELRELFRPLR
jgi:epoxide hydrolase